MADSTISVATGKDTRNKFNKSCQSYTTLGLFEPRITYFEDTVPGSSYKIDCRTFTRLEALIKPLLSHVRLHNRFFFVPYRTVHANFNNFIADTPFYQSLTSSTIPSIWKFKLLDLRALLINDAYHLTVATPSGETPDFYNTTGQGRTLTARGKTIYSLLISLGYVIDTSTNAHDNKYLSALPLLAYARVWYDYYRNTAFSVGQGLESYFNRIDSNPTLTISDLNSILDIIITVQFERDMFNSCTLYPTNTNESSQDSLFTPSDITSPTYGPVFQSGSGPQAAHAEISDGNQLTKYGLQLIQSLTDFQKRHQLAGIQPFNRILAEYGVTLNDEELNRSTFIGDNVVDVEISDVMSQGYSDGTTLGEYAGKGIGFNKKDFRFASNEFGAIICVTTIVPDFVMPLGINKRVLRTDRLSWFTPTFEHLGTEPVSSAELINVNPTDDFTLAGLDNIFGFLPRYYSYKFPYNIISGNFALNSVKNSYNGWIIYRDVDIARHADQRISPSFNEAYRTEVTNPFVMSQGNQFIVAHNFVVSAILPMHKLYDDYEFSNEIDHPDHVKIHGQGVQLT